MQMLFYFQQKLSLQNQKILKLRIFLVLQTIILEMIYKIPFTTDATVNKVFVIAASGVHLVVAILFIACAAQTIRLYDVGIYLHLSPSNNPLTGYMLFLGIQAMLVQTANIIQAIKDDLITLNPTVKWWIFFWAMFVNAGFVMAMAVGGAVGQAFMKQFNKSINDILNSYKGDTSSQTYIYYRGYYNILQLWLALTIMQFVLSLPLFAIMIIGLIKKYPEIGSAAPVGQETELNIQPPPLKQ